MQNFRTHDPVGGVGWARVSERPDPEPQGHLPAGTPPPAGRGGRVESHFFVVQAEQLLFPGKGVRYIYRIHQALRTACRNRLLSAEHKRALENIEIRTLQRLLLRACHTAPCPVQERAARRLPLQQLLMKELFQESYSDAYVDYDVWPTVTPPEKLIRKVFRKA